MQILHFQCHLVKHSSDIRKFYSTNFIHLPTCRALRFYYVHRYISQFFWNSKLLSKTYKKAVSRITFLAITDSLSNGIFSYFKLLKKKSSACARCLAIAISEVSANCNSVKCSDYCQYWCS